MPGSQRCTWRRELGGACGSHLDKDCKSLLCAVKTRGRDGRQYLFYSVSGLGDPSVGQVDNDSVTRFYSEGGEAFVKGEGRVGGGHPLSLIGRLRDVLVI